jgi:hypothetical protein
LLSRRIEVDDFAGKPCQHLPQLPPAQTRILQPMSRMAMRTIAGRTAPTTTKKFGSCAPSVFGFFAIHEPLWPVGR